MILLLVPWVQAMCRAAKERHRADEWQMVCCNLEL